MIGVKIPGLKLHRFPRAEFDLGRSGRLTLHGNVDGGSYVVHQRGGHFRWSKVDPPKDDLLAFLAGWWGARSDQAWDGEFKAATETECPKLPKRPTFVYFIGAAIGPIKIGIAEQPRTRLKILQTSYPYDLSILAMTPGPRSLEMEYHRKFAMHRLRGEWFERHEDILAAIREITG